jgi:integrase
MSPDRAAGRRKSSTIDPPPSRPLFEFGRRHLHSFAVSPATLAKYEKGCDYFHQWLRQYGLQYATVDELDEHLADYVNYMWTEAANSGSFQRAGHAVYGMPFRIPQARHHLPAAHLSLRGWQRTLVQKSPPPVSQDLAVALAVDLWDHECRDAAILVLLSHDCYLRAGEALRLKVADYADGAQVNTGISGLSTARGLGGVSLCKTKTGPNQFVTIRDPLLIALLNRHCATRVDGMPLFDINYTEYSRQFRASLRRVDVHEFGFVLHSLRHGGATHDFCNNVSHPSIQLRGRWQQLRSMVRYINAGVALSMRLRYSEHTTRCIQAARTHTHAWFGFVQDPRQ